MPIIRYPFSNAGLYIYVDYSSGFMKIYNEELKELVTPKGLNTAEHKYVHSALVKQLKNYYYSERKSARSKPHICEYRNVPPILIAQILEHIKYYNDIVAMCQK